jgi:hypothetical protein
MEISFNPHNLLYMYCAVAYVNHCPNANHRRKENKPMTWRKGIEIRITTVDNDTPAKRKTNLKKGPAHALACLHASASALLP